MLAAAVVALLLVVVVLLFYYRRQAARERLLAPRYVREVYYADASAHGSRAALATPAQLEIYRAEGGRPAPGMVALYGLKPPEGTPGVAPFSPGRWFTP